MEAANAARAAKALQDARDLLMQDGWCKGFLKKEERHCAMGATSEYAQLAFWNRVNDYLERAVRCLFPERVTVPNESKKHPIAQFNDHEDTTFNDVMAIYDEAILAAKELAAPLNGVKPTT